MLYLGRGTTYPLALEGALKLKEISYIHAEGYAAGELKHGPIALIDESMPVSSSRRTTAVSRRPSRTCRRSRPAAASIILITDDEGAHGGRPRDAGDASSCRRAHPVVAPIVYAVPVQLLAYHTAVFMGKDVDQPRNLAKSVTVE